MGDDWTAVDKLEHFLACLFITIFVTVVASSVRKLRRLRIPLGALAGLVCGAVKEAGDATGVFWTSAGASLKDGVADMAGVVAAVIFELLFFRLFSRSRLHSQVLEQPKVSMVDV